MLIKHFFTDVQKRHRSVLQVVDVTGLFQLVNFVKLQQLHVFKIRLVATCHLQTSCNLLKQIATTTLLTTCNRLAINKLSQAMRALPDIPLLITSPLENVNKLVATCAFLDA